jgi:hypothetical protein
MSTSSTTYDRGTGFGGDDNFEFMHGSQVIYSFPVDTDSNTDTWRRGDVLRLTNGGFAELDDEVGTSGLRFLANERRDPIDGRPEQNEVLASGKVSGYLDEGVFRSARLASGIIYSPNEKLYPDGAGKLTNVDAGSQPVMGKVLVGTGAVANGVDVFATFMYQNQSVSS